MYKKIRFSLILLTVFSVTQNVIAQDSDSQKEEKPWTEIVRIGGQIFIANYSLFNFDSYNSTLFYPDDTKENYTILRTRLNAEFNPINHLKFFIEFQDARRFGHHAIYGGDDTSNTDLHQAYIDFYNIGGTGLSLRFGRQEISFGKGRLVSTQPWSEIGLSLDGLRISYNINDKIDLDAFIFTTEREDSAKDEIFGGVHATFNELPFGNIDAYFLAKIDKDGNALTGGLKQILYTAGARLYKQPEVGLKYDLEAAYQFGELGPYDVSAWMMHASVGYRWKTKLMPGFQLSYDFASGDGNAADGDYNTFNDLYADNFESFGLLGFFGRRNIHDIGLDASLMVMPGFFLGLGYHAFILPEALSGQYLYVGIPGRSGSATAASFAGQELDLYFYFVGNEHLKAGISYSLFVPGEFFDDTASPVGQTQKLGHFIYAALKVKY